MEHADAYYRFEPFSPVHRGISDLQKELIMRPLMPISPELLIITIISTILNIITIIRLANMTRRTGPDSHTLQSLVGSSTVFPGAGRYLNYATNTVIKSGKLVPTLLISVPWASSASGGKGLKDRVA